MPMRPEDEEKLIKDIREKLNSIPFVVRPFIKPLPEILKEIPPYTYEYKVKDIIESLQKAWNNGKIRW